MTQRVPLGSLPFVFARHLRLLVLVVFVCSSSSSSSVRARLRLCLLVVVFVCLLSSSSPSRPSSSSFVLVLRQHYPPLCGSPRTFTSSRLIRVAHPVAQESATVHLEPTPLSISETLSLLLCLVILPLFVHSPPRSPQYRPRSHS